MMPTWNDYRNWLGRELRGTLPAAANAPQVDRIVTDTREVKSGDWFLPLRGERFDGHAFLEQALENGADGVFYEAARSAEVTARVQQKGLVVGSSLAAYQAIATGWRRSLAAKIFALTGSAGKTTTKEMLAQVLRQAGPTLATQASFNNEIGVPKTLLKLRPEHEYGVFEFGARRPGDIRLLCQVAEPDVAACLNVGRAHVGIFGSSENLFSAKTEMFRDSPPGATLITNHDDTNLLLEARKTGKTTLTFGTLEGADVCAQNAQWLTDGTMTVELKAASHQTGGPVVVKLPVAHESYPINAAAAAAMALAAGIPLHTIAKGLSSFHGVEGRFQEFSAGGLTVIDDTYNANPASMRAGLMSMAKRFPRHKKVVVLGDMLELGEESETDHKEVGRFAVETTRPSLIVAVGEFAEAFAAGAREAGSLPEQVQTYRSVQELEEAGVDFPRYGEVLYAKSSNAVGLSRLVADLKRRTQEPT